MRASLHSFQKTSRPGDLLAASLEAGLSCSCYSKKRVSQRRATEMDGNQMVVIGRNMMIVVIAATNRLPEISTYECSYHQ
jgi:hypothetical protein